MLNQRLIEYIKDVENPETNFNLAIEYLNIGQTAAALSYFLRCAERSKENLDLSYECLIHIGKCFDKQGNRSTHAYGCFKHAISILPKRPEAYYYICRIKNWNSLYDDAYYHSSIALNVCDFDNIKPLRNESEYTGIHCLLFEKALASWHWGKVNDCKSKFLDLVDNYWDELNDYQKNICKKYLKDHYDIFVEDLKLKKSHVENSSILYHLNNIVSNELSENSNQFTPKVLEQCYEEEDTFSLAIEYKKTNEIIYSLLLLNRSIEKFNDNLDIKYECLIHIGECLDILGNRIELVIDVYKYAASILPRRPEAYYMLANYQNWCKQHQNAYETCHESLKCSDFDSPSFRFKSKYPGKWGILYELTTSSLFCDKSMETREVLKDILNNHWDELDEYHQQNVEYRLCSLGSGPPDVAITPYDASKHSQLRHKFVGSENIKRNFSQVYQDMFVLSVLDGKRNGTFLEIGGAEPFHMNNTALLETQYGWNGVSIEYKQEFVDQYREVRPTKAYCLDALSIDYDQFIDENFDTDIIDYLQLDIEPARNTYSLLQKIPFEKYKFRVITYEHDHYVDVTKECRQKSREYLKSKGYVLLVNDISPEGRSNFEDWWVHPDLINPELLKKMSGNDGKIKKAETFMLTPQSISEKKVVDCFPFFIEKELLELRVNLLKDHVDEFIICEMNRTHSGAEKKFIAKDTIRELGLPEDKIRVIELSISDDDEIVADEGDIFHANDAKSSKPKNSTRERLQRDSVMSVLDEYSDDTVFILSDCDEIINPNFVSFLSNCSRKTTNNIIKIPLVCLEGRADKRIYDGEKPLPWKLSMVMCTKKQLSSGGSPTIFRGNYNNPFPPIWVTGDQECGWHFTFMGSKEMRKYKAESCAHSDNLDVYYNLTSDTLKEIGGTISNDNISLRDYPIENLPKIIFDLPRVKKFLFPEKSETEQHVVTFNINNPSISKPTAFIVDNFYEDPDAVREFALNQDYHIGGIGRGYIGNRTFKQFLFPGLKERFEEIIGKKITKWEEHDMNGRFQYCWSGQPLVYHCDNQKFGGMLYLSPDAPYQCGTSLFAHKQTRARNYYEDGWDKSWMNIPGDPHLDGTPFEPVDVMGNVYNRLVIFDASSIHSASEYFGTVKENCRLWQMFFFDA